jgi:MraZ protein
MLREYAGLSRELVWAGMVTYVEIWSKDSWTEQAASARVNRTAIARALTELGL